MMHLYGLLILSTHYLEIQYSFINSQRSEVRTLTFGIGSIAVCNNISQIDVLLHGRSSRLGSGNTVYSLIVLDISIGCF